MKIILCGYHWTGCKALELLLEEGHEVYVYTHETENGIADLEGLCVRKNVMYTMDKITPENLPFFPDVICSIYYRWIIQQEIIDIVKGRIFNLHPSLLPKYRGCSSLTWAMINGEKECGFTYHYIDAGCDTGKIILQERVVIEDFDTQLTLYNRVMFESMKFFLKALDLVINGYPGTEQSGCPTYYKKVCPLGGIITDSMDGETRERFIRAMCYPPYPAAQYNGLQISTLWELQKVLGGNRIVIFGCGGHARSVVNTIHLINRMCTIVLVDEKAADNERIMGCPVIRNYMFCEDDRYIVAVGDNRKRRKIFEALIEKGYRGRIISIITPTAFVGEEVQIGSGIFIAGSAYIGPLVKIGDNSIINTASAIEHEAVIGAHSHIAPNATICGRVVVGNNVLCGAGSTVIDGVKICDNVVIGAGTVVVKDILVPGIYVGTPARLIHKIR